MAIDTQEKAINIKDLVIDEPEKPVEKYSFDPAEEITEEEWDKFEYIALLDQDFISPSIASFLAGFKVLSPERFKKLNLPEPNWENYAEQERKAGNLDSKMLSDYVFVFGKKPEEMGSAIRWSNIEKRLHLEAFSPSYLAHYFWADVNKFKDLKLDEQTNSRIRKGIFEDIYYSREFHSPSRFAFSLVSMRILLPEEFNKFKITKEDWQGMREEFERRKNEMVALSPSVNIQTDDSVNFFRNIRIIAAEKMQIDENGYNLEMKSDHTFGETIPAVPEVKRYG